ncbi:MAG: class I SAM-dependent methyltransferase [Thermoplasmata archaeon]
MLEAHVGKETMVLDVGCGDGTTMKHLGGNCVGIDISIEALRFAKANSEADVVVGSALALPFREESFDVIVCTEVLEHLGEMEIAIEHLAALLKPEGIVHFTVPLASWYRLFLFRFLGIRPYYLSEDEHKREFSAIPVERFDSISSLISMIENHGLRIEEMEGSYFFPDRIEGPLDKIVNDSARMREFAKRLDNILDKIPRLSSFGRYLALSCRKAEEPQTKSS